MKNHIPTLVRFCFGAIFLLVFSSISIAQEEEADTKDLRPVKNMFESIWLIDQQTAIVPFKGTFEWDFQHRFGVQ